MAAKPRFDGEWVRLGDICTVVSGSTPKTKIPEYWGGEIRWVTPAELSDSAHYIVQTAKHITEAGFASASLRMLPVGTVLLTSRAPIGKVAITKSEMCCNQGFKNLLCSDAVFNEFLFRTLRHRSTALQSMGRGATFKELSKKSVESFEVRLPSKEEQFRIVKELEDVERPMIEAGQLLSKLDALVKSRFVEMFTGVKYPLAQTSDFMGNFRNGVSPSKKGEAYSKVLTLSAVTQGKFDSSAWKNGTFKEMPPADRRVSERDFYICRGNGNKGLVGAAAFADRDYPELVFPDTMIAGVVDDAKINRAYLSCAWSQPAVRSQIESRARTTNGTFKINQGIIASVQVPLPPLVLQQEFAAFAAEVDKSRFIVRQQIEKLQTLYDSLAQEYFS